MGPNIKVTAGYTEDGISVDLFMYDEFEQPEDLVVAISAAIAAYEGL